MKIGKKVKNMKIRSKTYEISLKELGEKLGLEGKIIWVTSAIGLGLSLWAFYTFYVVYPAVLWVPIAMLISVFLLSYLGGLVVTRSRSKKSAPTKKLTSA